MMGYRGETGQVLVARVTNLGSSPTSYTGWIVLGGTFTTNRAREGRGVRFPMDTRKRIRGNEVPHQCPILAQETAPKRAENSANTAPKLCPMAAEASRYRGDAGKKECCGDAVNRSLTSERPWSHSKLTPPSFLGARPSGSAGGEAGAARGATPPQSTSLAG